MCDYTGLKLISELSGKFVMKIGILNNISEENIYLLKKTKTFQMLLQLVVYNPANYRCFCIKVGLTDSCLSTNILLQYNSPVSLFETGYFPNCLNERYFYSLNSALGNTHLRLTSWLGMQMTIQDSTC